MKMTNKGSNVKKLKLFKHLLIFACLSYAQMTLLTYLLFKQQSYRLAIRMFA